MENARPTARSLVLMALAALEFNWLDRVLEDVLVAAVLGFLVERTARTELDHDWMLGPRGRE